MQIKLERAYMPDGSCTLGKMTLENGWSCTTLENPWLDNQRKISCIPEGTYKLRKRISPIVNRTSKNEFDEGWEVVGVEGRSLIMVHIGNYERNTHGCILTGEGYSYHQTEGFTVTSSANAFRQFMYHLNQEEEHTLTITSTNASRTACTHSQDVFSPDPSVGMGELVKRLTEAYRQSTGLDGNITISFNTTVGEMK